MLDNLFIAVLNMSIISSYVILLVMLARLLLKKAPTVFSFALWLVVLLRLICPFTVESIVGILPSNTTPIAQDILYQQVPQINTGIVFVDQSINAALPPATIGNSINPLQVGCFIASSIWILGIVVLLSYSVVQYIRLKQKLVGSTLLRENIYMADHISTPFVMGMFRPKIYLPSSCIGETQPLIIAHEQCHIKRLDHVTRIVGFLVLVIHWFNPLVWGAFILSGKDMEMSCDEAVMKQLKTDMRTTYSYALLQYTVGQKGFMAMPLAFGEGDTKGRIKNVMKYKKPMMGVVIGLSTLVALIAIIVGTNKTGSMQPDTMKQANNLRAEDIVSIELVVMPSKVEERYRKLEIREFADVVALINESKGKLVASPEPISGGVVTFYIEQKDGKALLITNEGNRYLKINEDTYEANTQWLSSWSNYKGNTSIPEDLKWMKVEREKEPSVANDHKLTHEEAVSLALTTTNDFVEGECPAEGHIIMGYDDTDSKLTKIYALTMRGNYGFENNAFVKVSGTGVIPLVITVGQDNHITVEGPLDGSEYITSIKKMFPEVYHDRIFLDSEADYMNLKQQEEKYAKDYLKTIGRTARVGEYADFEHLFLSDLGVTVEVSNNIEDFYKAHSYYPYFVGTKERLEDGRRMVYEMSYQPGAAYIVFDKYTYDTKNLVESYRIDAKTGEIVN